MGEGVFIQVAVSNCVCVTECTASLAICCCCFLLIKSLFYGYFVCHLSCLGLGQGKGMRVYGPCQAEVQGIWGLDGTLEVIKHRDSQT